MNNLGKQIKWVLFRMNCRRFYQVYSLRHHQHLHLQTSHHLYHHLHHLHHNYYNNSLVVGVYDWHLKSCKPLFSRCGKRRTSLSANPTVVAKMEIIMSCRFYCDQSHIETTATAINFSKNKSIFSLILSTVPLLPYAYALPGSVIAHVIPWNPYALPRSFNSPWRASDYMRKADGCSLFWKAIYKNTKNYIFNTH